MSPPLCTFENEKLSTIETQRMSDIWPLLAQLDGLLVRGEPGVAEGLPGGEPLSGAQHYQPAQWVTVLSVAVCLSVRFK